MGRDGDRQGREGAREGMVIDCHGHYTTVPRDAQAFRRCPDREAAALPRRRRRAIDISDDRDSRERDSRSWPSRRRAGTDLTIFSPRASAMGAPRRRCRPPICGGRSICNDLIHRVCTLFPKQFVGVCQLPQTTGGSPADCVGELERCVNELGFIGCNLNPDPSGGHWTAPPLTDRAWYPLYEKLVELDVPAMVHVSASCNPSFHATGAHYLNADTTAFMQFLSGDLFRDFPTLRFVIPHGGGAVPYHWGRYRGLAQDMKRPPLTELIRDNIFFDTCVYHYPGIELLLKVVPVG